MLLPRLLLTAAASLGILIAATVSPFASAFEPSGWTLLSSPAWEARCSMGLVAANGSLVVIGGADSSQGCVTDVWRSYGPREDNWSETNTDLGWRPRSSFGTVELCVV